ncbi:MAG: hypothetical protein D6775_08165 [Caldilineae bacterium]|nr:MAG: hypothetical protein D6775_08165 [Caldilineae bacterium]
MRRTIAALGVLLAMGMGQTPEEFELRKAECEGRVRVCWDPADRAESYEIAVASVGKPCLSGLRAADVCQAGVCCAKISGTQCDVEQDGSGLVVRARNQYGVSPSWSNVAPMLPCACVEVGGIWGTATRACEVPCYPGSPDRLPNDEREKGCDM